MMATENTQPLIVIFLYINFVIGILADLLFIFVVPEKIHEMGAWAFPFIVLSLLGKIVAVLGLWKMKKWSVPLVVVIYVVNNIVLLATGNIFSTYALLISGIIIWFFIKQYPKMA